MVFMRIHCGRCGGTWEIYQRDNWKADTARQCPHCFKEISGSTWEREILPAFGSVCDANAELVKESIGYNKPVFTVDIIASRQSPEQNDTRQQLYTEYENFIYE